MLRFVFLLCLVLTGCATPREACLRAATRDLAVVDRLIARTEADLARGFGLTETTVATAGLDLCLGVSGGSGLTLGLRYCPGLDTRVVEQPVAIDPAAERRKLRQLRSTRERLLRDAAKAQAACSGLEG